MRVKDRAAATRLYDFAIKITGTIYNILQFLVRISDTHNIYTYKVIISLFQAFAPNYHSADIFLAQKIN